MSKGLLNRAINNLPIELHVPGYQFCGPGTHLAKRLERGDCGINQLDAACREHDIAYSRYKDLPQRHEADKQLAKQAKQRITSKGATLGERAAATAVWMTMNLKRKLGMGLNTVKKQTKKLMKTKKKKNSVKTTKRRIQVPKWGGFLPLLPLLGAVGALAGGASGIAKAVNDAKSAKKHLEEMQRHNRAMERGRGLYLAPYSKKNGGSIKKKIKK